MENQPSVKYRHLSLSTLLLASLFALVGLGAGIFVNLDQDNTSPLYQPKPVITQAATLLPTPRPLQPFTLSAHDATSFTLASLRGKWTLLNFGYTHCPDICPTTLALLSLVRQQLQAAHLPKAQQVVFVTIDPERDTRERLKQFVPYFNKAFLGITGEKSQLEAFTRQLGVVYRKAESGESRSRYLMDHSASILLINPDGELHALFSVPHNAETISGDLIRIARRWQ